MISQMEKRWVIISILRAILISFSFSRSYVVVNLPQDALRRIKDNNLEFKWSSVHFTILLSFILLRQTSLVPWTFPFSVDCKGWSFINLGCILYELCHCRRTFKINLSRIQIWRRKKYKQKHNPCKFHLNCLLYLIIWTFALLIGRHCFYLNIFLI